MILFECIKQLRERSENGKSSTTTTRNEEQLILALEVRMGIFIEGTTSHFLTRTTASRVDFTVGAVARCTELPATETRATTATFLPTTRIG